MVRLELSLEEKEELVHALNLYISNLRMEIADTDSSFFRADLKKEKHILNSVLQKLLKTSEPVMTDGG